MREDEYSELAKCIAEKRDIPSHLVPILRELYIETADNGQEGSSKLPKEYELIYATKNRKEEIIANTKIAPLQKIKVFSGNSNNSWENKLIFGDNLKALKSLTLDPDVKGKVKLIYIDPPFATKQDFMKNEVKAYADKIVGSEFIEFIRKRLLILRELLSDDGVIFVHLDSKKGHYIKIIMDEVFGESNFRNEIVWCYSGGGVPRKDYPRKHDVIFRYSKSNNYSFKVEFKPYKENTQAVGKHSTAAGKSGRSIEIDLDRGTPVTDWWVDIPTVTGWRNEGADYPTQKPEPLLARIINASTDEGDLVLDAFAGSGTTLAVAEKLGRKWIGIDCGKLSIYTIQNRMLSLKEEIGNKGKNLKHKPFSVFNAGLYDYKEIENLDFESYRKFLLQLFQVRDKKHEINGVEMDGYIKRYSALLWKHKDKKNLVINDTFMKSLDKSLSGKGGSVVYVIAPSSVFEFQDDYKNFQETQYRFLRIPQSIIDELVASNGKSLLQPRSEGNVNDIVEALAFDFIRVPKVKRTLKLSKPLAEDLLNFESKLATIKITEFISMAVANSEFVSDLEKLSLVLTDTNYDGKVFRLSEVFFGEKIVDGTIQIPTENLGKELMIIYVDIYGNEYRESIKSTEFGIKK